MSPKRINTRKLSYNSRHRLHDHTCTSGKAAILQIPNNPANPASDNEPEAHKHSQTLVIACMTTPAPVARPPSCKSQTVPQILLQTVRPTHIYTCNGSPSLVDGCSSATLQAGTGASFPTLTTMLFSFRMPQTTQQPSSQLRQNSG